jgi:hypothetical protein
MAIGCTVIDASARVRIVDITVPEGDAVNVDTVFTWQGAGPIGLGLPTNMIADPQVKFAINKTLAAIAPTASDTISIYSVDATGFHVQKTSAAVGAKTQTYRAWFFARLLGEF